MRLTILFFFLSWSGLVLGAKTAETCANKLASIAMGEAEESLSSETSASGSVSGCSSSGSIPHRRGRKIKDTTFTLELVDELERASFIQHCRQTGYRDRECTTEAYEDAVIKLDMFGSRLLSLFPHADFSLKQFAKLMDDLNVTGVETGMCHHLITRHLSVFCTYKLQKKYFFPNYVGENGQAYRYKKERLLTRDAVREEKKRRVYQRQQQWKQSLMRSLPASLSEAPEEEVTIKTLKKRSIRHRIKKLFR